MIEGRATALEEWSAMLKDATEQHAKWEMKRKFFDTPKDRGK
jgi:hypothetical protein